MDLQHDRAVRVGTAAAVLALTALPVLAHGAAPTDAPSITGLTNASLEAVRFLSPPTLPQQIDAWTAPGPGRHVIDDFESDTWPDAATWVAVQDLTGGGGSEHLWAPRDCLASAGGRSLWSVGGGADGSALPCGSAAHRPLQTSALLALDLTRLHSMAKLDLVMDVWADAAPTEGLLVNYVEFDDAGTTQQRRTVYSATGRSTDWSRGVRVDLTALGDPLDPSWHLDLRGQFAYLEFLFLGVSGAGGGGMFVDELAVESERYPPIIVTSDRPTATPRPTDTPRPTATATAPADRTEACTTEPDCRSLEVRSFVDYRCDGQFQNGYDALVRSEPRTDVTAGAERLGTNLDRRGRATFRLPTSQGAEVQLAVPTGFEMCPNSANPLVMAPDDFRATGLTRVYFRIVPQR